MCPLLPLTSQRSRLNTARDAALSLHDCWVNEPLHYIKLSLTYSTESRADQEQSHQASCFAATSPLLPSHTHSLMLHSAL